MCLESRSQYLQAKSHPSISQIFFLKKKQLDLAGIDQDDFDRTPKLTNHDYRLRSQETVSKFVRLRQL
jgi:hypothetical protein